MKRLIAMCVVSVLLIGSVAVADTVTVYNPSTAVFCPNQQYSYMTDNWQNWLAMTGWHGIGWQGNADGPTGYINWSVDFGSLSGPVTAATVSFQANNGGDGYGIQTGRTLEVAATTQYWDLRPPPSGSPVTVGAPASYVVTESVAYRTILTVDITAMAQAWQADPSTFYGVRMRSPDGGGGVLDPNSEWGDYITGNLTLTVGESAAVPEPGTLMLLGTGAVGVFGFIRRRKMA